MNFGRNDMPELPDITVYVEALARRLVGERVIRVDVRNPFVLRTVDPSIADVNGKEVLGIERIGKRIVLRVESELFIVIHLMIAGRLRWLPHGKTPPRKIALALFQFASGTLVLTEAGSTRRASLSLVRGRVALGQFDRGGLDVMSVSFDDFAARLRGENHTLKRALTDPRLFDGIGNAYSDEILHHARLSPVMLTSRIGDTEARRLYMSARAVLQDWTERLRTDVGDGFPEGVTAFRPDMAVHGKYQEPCPVCGAPVQRIRYANNETDYCARCQTGGKLLADRALSRLLKKDWPRSIDELYEP